MALEIVKMIVLSTANITKRTADMFEMDTDGVPIFYEKGDWGWIVPVIKGHEWPHTCPEDLLAIRAFAIANECEWIMLDCDGDPVEELPLYDW